MSLSEYDSLRRRSPTITATAPVGNDPKPVASVPPPVRANLDPQKTTAPSSPIPPSVPTTRPDRTRPSLTSVPMERKGGTFAVPVLINNKIELNFVVDSGASNVSIPADVVRTMMRTGTLTAADFVGKRTYILADGSRVEARTFRIRSLKVGERIVENVLASEAPFAGELLLGQTFLGKFKSWSIDNATHALVLE